MTSKPDPLIELLRLARRKIEEAELHSEEDLREACHTLQFYGTVQDARDARAMMNELDGLTPPADEEKGPTAGRAFLLVLIGGVVGYVLTMLLLAAS